MGFWKATWSAVLAAAIFAVAAWLFGFLPAVWTSIKAFAGSAWDMLNRQAPIPIWFVAVLIVAAMLAGARLTRAESSSTGTKPLPKAPDLSPTELLVLRALERADGRPLNINEIASDCSIRWLVAQQAVDHLGQRGFISMQDGGAVPKFFLGREGRDYVLSGVEALRKIRDGQ